tara:strand:- start:115 stop:264 length:150 start_codon:yes stop_codon:yes gene_type:complete
LNKLEKKFVKLSSKAQDCVSRKKAQKILKKYEKARTASYDSTRGDNSLV